MAVARKTPIERYRNIGISAHIDAGKTTTTERILFYTASTTRSARCTTAPRPWTGWSRSRSAASPSRRPPPRASGRDGSSYPEHRINIIDTPGHVDFTIEVERSLRVLDGACMVYDAVAACRSPRRCGARLQHCVPRLAFINKMDRGATFFKSYEHIRARLKGNPVPIQLPIGAEDKFAA